MKYIILVISCDVFTSMEVNFCNPSLYDTSEEMLCYIKKKVENTMRILTVYRVWVAITLLAFLGTPCFDNAGTYRYAPSRISAFLVRLFFRLLSPAIFPWKVQDTKSHFFTLFVQSCSSTIGASLAVTVDCTFAIFCTIAKMELHLLKENFRTMHFSRTNKQIKFELKKNMLLYDNILK